MLTSRAWWLVVLLASLLVLSLFLTGRQAESVLLVPLVPLLWLGWEWFAFQWRVARVLPRLRVRREFRVGGREVPSLWAGMEAEVRVELSLPEGDGLPFVHARDLLPVEFTNVRGTPAVAARLGPNAGVIAYAATVPTPGVVRFEGVRLVLTDLQGFFSIAVTVREARTVPALPSLVRPTLEDRSGKRVNQLPPPGSHRHRKPGGGSELLELRDYVPGDPPKLIAWKASARRDRLITREYESEVPIRVTLLLDAGPSVRLGPPGDTALHRAAAVAAAVAQAALLRRDLVGLTVVDGESARVIRPARSDRHRLQVLHALARAVAPVEPATLHPLDRAAVVSAAGALATEVYPDLLRPEVNSTPWRMLWRPLLDSRRGPWIIALMLSPLLLAFPIVRQEVAAFARQLAGGSERWLIPAFLGTIVSPIFLGMAFWLLFGLRDFVLPGGRRSKLRKRLAAVLAEVQNLPPGSVGRMEHDDAFLGERSASFLAAHHLPVPALSAAEQPDGRASAKAAQLARALTRGVFLGRDNELFVIIADLVSDGPNLDPLLAAVRVARARHHQVAVLVPWPAGVPLPGEPVPPPKKRFGTVAGLAADLRDAVAASRHAAWEAARTALARAGVPAILAEPGAATRVVLDRLERLRHPMRSS